MEQSLEYKNLPKKQPLRKSARLAEEDVWILGALEKIKVDLAATHRSLDVVTDPVLIDSFIYEMNALHMRYKYYLDICKERGIIKA